MATVQEPSELIRARESLGSRSFAPATLTWVPTLLLIGCVLVLTLLAFCSQAIQYLKGVAVFAAFLLTPGYCVGWLSNLLGFRHRRIGDQLAWAVCLSFGLVGIVGYAIGKYLSLGAFAVVCVASMIGFAALGVAKLRALKPNVAITSAIRRWRSLALLAFAWITFVAAELLNVVFRGRTYLNVAVFDLSLRAAFVDAVARTGVVPANPLFWPGHPVPLHYYYFWYIIAGSVAKLSHISGSAAILASVSWAGIGLATMIYLYCREFLPVAADQNVRLPLLKNRWSRPALAMAMLLITGLDLLPTLAGILSGTPLHPDMEWWSLDQVTSWLDSLMWVPHHVAGLVCCLIGFLLVWLSKDANTGQRFLCAVIAGLAFASAAGTSSWVALGFAIATTAWALWTFATQSARRKCVGTLTVACVFTAVAVAPYLKDLRVSTEQPTSHSTSETHPGAAANRSDTGEVVGIRIRHIFNPTDLRGADLYEQFAEHHPFAFRPLWLIALMLLLLVPGYAIELGFYGAVLLIARRAKRRLELDDASRTCIFMSTCVLWLTTFMGSTVISMNDFGWRSILIAQFFLLLLAIRWLEGAYGTSRRWTRVCITAAIWLGVAGSFYQGIELRTYLPTQEALGRPFIRDLSRHVFALQDGFEKLNEQIPQSAVVQFNSFEPIEYVNYAELMLARRQMAVGQPGCGYVFGGTKTQCELAEPIVAKLFSVDGLSVASSDQAQAYCRSLGVDFLIATRWDRVWLDPSGWVWQLPAVVDTGSLRAVRCSARGA